MFAPEQPAFFHGVVPFAWKPNRVYRVYVLPGELAFIYLGSAGEVSAVIGSQFGVAGRLIADQRQQKKQQQAAERLEGVPLDELIARHKNNFRATGADLSAIGVDSRSAWLAYCYSQPRHVGILRFTHASKGKMRLFLHSVDDVRVAVDCLPAALGSQVAVNVEWNAAKKKFVKKG